MLPIVDRRNILRSAAADDAFAALRQAETEVGSVLQPVRNHLNALQEQQSRNEMLLRFARDAASFPERIENMLEQMLRLAILDG